ncbi:MAG: RNA-binding protein [Chromatiales bacterium]|nr:RNA-binding protein [Gammaproteobacteria bacterium]MBW6475477.1 RNA-binding protein [Chromatiales bacterium]
MTEAAQKLRLDKWLWAARFFKTRALATEAINGGHVQLNGHRPKPARALQVGDELEIVRGQERLRIRVLGLSERRGPAVQAQQLYEEDEASRRQREQQAELRKLEAAGVQPGGRPDKKGRRQIHRFKQLT